MFFLMLFSFCPHSLSQRAEPCSILTADSLSLSDAIFIATNDPDLLFINIITCEMFHQFFFSITQHF